jgi:PD-(D/E)XK nuclease superfamily
LKALFKESPERQLDYARLEKNLSEWRKAARKEMKSRIADIPLDDPIYCPISLFGTMDFGRMETAHTRTLRWLFDPYQGHGFGDLLLREFITELFPELADVDLKTANVRAEHRIQKLTTGSWGRIDILANGSFQDVSTNCVSNWVLLIEAKIDASESDSQLEGYEEWAKANYPTAQVYHVFLTPDGRLPESGSDAWKSASFITLASVLRRNFERLKELPGYHFLRFYVSGVLKDICDWKLPVPDAETCADPYGYVEYMRKVTNNKEKPKHA